MSLRLVYSHHEMLEQRLEKSWPSGTSNDTAYRNFRDDDDDDDDVEIYDLLYQRRQTPYLCK